MRFMGHNLACVRLTVRNAGFTRLDGYWQIRVLVELIGEATWFFFGKLSKKYAWIWIWALIPIKLPITNIYNITKK